MRWAACAYARTIHPTRDCTHRISCCLLLHKNTCVCDARLQVQYTEWHVFDIYNTVPSIVLVYVPPIVR